MSEKVDHGGPQFELCVVVGGAPVQVTANPHAPLHTILSEALRKSENVGQPPENWEFTDAPGNVLDANKKIGELGLTEHTKVFLRLKAGIAGG